MVILLSDTKREVIMRKSWIGDMDLQSAADSKTFG